MKRVKCKRRNLRVGDEQNRNQDLTRYARPMFRLLRGAELTPRALVCIRDSVSNVCDK